MVRPERFELPTPWFVAKCSIQLSYGRISYRQIPNVSQHYCIGSACFPLRGMASTGVSAVV
jgi:hypothetical protein